MELPFALDDAEVVEFGLVIEGDDTDDFVLVPSGSDVQMGLTQMVSSTQTRLESHDGPVSFDPGEKYASTEHLTVSLENDYASWVKTLHTATNIRSDALALRDATDATAYFARVIAEDGQRVTGVRRAATFKGIVKARGRLVRLVDDTIRIVDDDVFKLDTDFDVLALDDTVHILRPSGFEFVCHLQSAILNAAPKNIASLKSELTFVDFSVIEQYASAHPRAARYISSIRTTQDVANIGQAELRQLCRATGVKVTSKKGKLVVGEEDVLGFLEVLDRRRYDVRLVPDSPEKFRAASRKRIL